MDRRRRCNAAVLANGLAFHLLPTPVAVAVVNLDLRPAPSTSGSSVNRSGEAERCAFVVFFDVPGHANLVDAREESVE